MPSEYQAHCSQCGHKGPLIHWGYQALILDTSRVVPLPHPREAQTLREHGYSFFSAGVRGRYARVDYRVCLDCGAQSERAVLGFPVTVMGCLIVVALLSLLTLGGALAGLPKWLLPVLGIGSWFGLTWVSTRLVRIVYLARQRALPSGSKCDACGGTQLRDVASALQHDLPCPACEKKSYRLHAIDMVPS